ncbi:MAG: slipin family protein, partial [Chloroflexi bacterium]|nr:slipin family protein [Chloroflexota bacterium]
MPSQTLFITGAVVVLLVLLIPAIRIVWQYQRGVVFRFGKLVGERRPG